jgi:hypothetical protein
MQGDNGLLIDIGQVREVVEDADVFVVGFANFTERLLIDARSNEDDGPMVRIVEPMGSVQERLFWLGKERGAFGMPRAFTFFAWPHTISYLEQCGLWARVRERVGAGADLAVGAQCDEALERLRALEREVLSAAILGERFVTLWPPEPAQTQ